MRHPFHLVEQSPWPLFISLNLLFLLIGVITNITGYMYGNYTLILSFINVLFILINWFIDIITESLYLGYHSYKVSRGLILGFINFILTEIMLFFSLFWAYFHSALNPFYLVWPPIGIDLINPWSIPFLNTFLLLYSGIFITYAHHIFIANNRKISLNWLGIGIFLGFIFILLQLFEYTYSSYDISDSVYSSSFFLLTGFHGFHVIFGIIFLSTVWFKILKYHNCDLTFNLSVLYWHLVDIVWIILFILIYYMSY
jgi:cytochrome c oxidase subunit 3